MLCARESCVQRRVDLRRITIIIFYIYNFIIIIKLHGVILLLFFFFYLVTDSFFFFTLCSRVECVFAVHTYVDGYK